MFIATIRRHGGAFAKGPMSMNMPALPVQTSASNLATYFGDWPKRRATYLAYGTSQVGGQTRSFGIAREDAAQGMRDMDLGGEEFSLYGPKPVTPLTELSRGAVGGPADGGAAAAKAAKAVAAAKAAAAAQKSLGLGGVLRRFKKGQKLTMITAYDFPSSRFARAAGVDLVLVGDSVGNCRLGLTDTVGVTMDDMLRATASARRGLDSPSPDAAGPKPVLVGDMPFGSYLVLEDCLKHAAAFRIAGADMVKLEGGSVCAPLIRALTSAGIAVMGHIGLEPQSAFLQGGLRMQGTTAPAAMKLVKAAKELAEAGAVMLVLECVPLEVGHAVQASVDIPVIGIGAGKEVAGQVLVCDDLLGIHGSAPSFVKQYADLSKATAAAYQAYASEVRGGAFPGEAHSRRLKAEELDKLRGLMPEQLVWPQPSPEPAKQAAAREPPAAADRKPFRESAKWSPQPFPSKPTVVGSASAFGLIQGQFAPLPKLNHLRLISSGSALGRGPGQVQVLRTRNEVREWRQGARRVGLVPTMGNLHKGHLELVDEAKKHADDVLATIFVNPAQFAAHEDLDKYPRTFERDVELLAAHGAAAVFAPLNSDEMYPHGSPGGTVVVPRFVAGKSEDAARPHFFTGVATVCLKLFNLTQPHVAVFGQKDAMQCVVISRMLQDLLLDDQLQLVVAPTSREADGLAMSSRNSYLTPGMREKAPAIYAALSGATQGAGATPGSVRGSVREALAKAGMEVTYVSVADPHEMNEKEDGAPLANSVVSLACLLREGDRECRLIDNVVVPA